MKILIITTSDKRQRYLSLFEPVRYIENVKVSLFKNHPNIVIYVCKSFAYAKKNKVVDYVIICGCDLKGFLWALLTRFVMKSKLVLRLGGDPFDVRKKLLRTVLGNHEFMRYIKLAVNYLLTKVVFRYADLVTVVNKSLVDRASKYTGQGVPISVIPQFIRIKQEKYVERRKKKNSLYLLTITNLSYKDKFSGIKKVVRYLISRLNGHDLGFRIVYNIVGGGYYLSALRDFLEEFEIKSEYLEINVEGYINNPGIFYEKADLFIYCSTLDATPNVLLEAQSYGLPILVNSYEPFHYMLKKNMNALFFNENDEHDFYRKLREILQNESLRGEMGRNNLNYFKRNYSIDVIAQKWKTVLSNRDSVIRQS